MHDVFNKLPHGVFKLCIKVKNEIENRAENAYAGDIHAVAVMDDLSEAVH